MAHAQTIARPYAKAVFTLARRDAERQQWQQFLQVIVDLLASSQAGQHLRTPGFLSQFKQWINECLTEIRGCSMTIEESNLLHLLEKNGRIVVLPEILESFVDLCSMGDNSCIVHVQTARELDAQVQQKLIHTLEKKLGRSVSLDIKETPDLMAGIIIEYDGQIVDQSLRGRLEQFSRTLDD